MTGDHWYVRNEQQRRNVLDAVQAYVIGDFGFAVKIETGKRTLAQNSAMYKYFELLAKELNDAGMELHMEYLGKSIDVPWGKESVKERLWNPIMEAQTGKKSTTRLDRKEISEIYETLHRHMAQTHAIMVPFPSHEPPMI